MNVPEPKFVPLHPTDVEIVKVKTTLEACVGEHSGIYQSIRPLETMNVCTNFMGMYPGVVEVFQYGPKWWTD